MAQRTVTLITDDLDGTTAVETVTFGLDGKLYEVDLNEKNAATLRRALEKFVGVARRAGSLSGATVASRGRARRSTATDYDPTAVRAWAAANGVEVSPRGRISGSVLERYRAAGN